MNYLVVGAGSVAGQAAIRAAREHDSEARIVGTTSRPLTGDESAGGAAPDEWIGEIDFNKEDSVARLQSALAGRTFAYLFYTPAFGPLGFPISGATEEQIREALAFSYDPMVALAEGLESCLTIGFTSFFWQGHALGMYGAMAYAKHKQERLAVAKPERFRMLRVGTFMSKGTRGISLFLQRAVRKTDYERLKWFGEQWKASGKKFPDWLFDYAYDCEREEFQDRFETQFARTTPEHVTRGVKRILAGESAPIVNVMGIWDWTDASAKSDLPVDFKLLDSSLLRVG